MSKVLVVGAGFGGLAAAAELAKKGLDVTILEAHTAPGGSASSFFHKGYQFDAGATLAGGFAPGAPMHLLSDRFGIDWEKRLTSRAMVVHLPDGSKVTRYTDSSRWRSERQKHFGSQAEQFWDWQENTADVMWNLAMRLPSWPPQTRSDSSLLTKTGINWLTNGPLHEKYHRMPTLIADAVRPVAAHLPAEGNRLKMFIDGQLLISAQTTSSHANALYGASALDLPRRGVGHIPGGMVSMAHKLVGAIRRFGGKVHYRQEVLNVKRETNGSYSVRTNKKETFYANIVIFNLPPWNISKILIKPIPDRLKHLSKTPGDGWGAFMIYAGIEQSIVPHEYPLHHQVIIKEPLGEGNSIFLSLSPAWDKNRSPEGKQALTISTHTNLDRWWQLHKNNQMEYGERKEAYTERILDSAETILPGLIAGTELLMSGTPVTFQHYTRRAWGWVGGFPQTNLFRNWGPRLSKHLWMVGDTIFPGQSVPAVSLGGLRVAKSILAEVSKKSRLNPSPDVQNKSTIE